MQKLCEMEPTWGSWMHIANWAARLHSSICSIILFTSTGSPPWQRFQKISRNALEILEVEKLWETAERRRMSVAKMWKSCSSPRPEAECSWPTDSESNNLNNSRQQRCEGTKQVGNQAEDEIGPVEVYWCTGRSCKLVHISNYQLQSVFPILLLQCFQFIQLEIFFGNLTFYNLDLTWHRREAE